MFGRSKRTHPNSTDHAKHANHTNEAASPKGPIAWDVPVFFGIMFVLSIVELGFTADIYQWYTRKDKWHGNTEKMRLGFLLFSCVRTIALSAAYCGFHFARKYFHSMLHTIFLVLSTIIWVVSGVLIHTMWGYIECGGVGQAEGGINECHELKIIEILAWVIAAVSVVATVPVTMSAMKRRKNQLEAHHNAKTAVSG